MELTCPRCHHQCRTDRILGKSARLRCPACAHEFSFAAVQPPFVAPFGAALPPISYEAGTKRCAFCHEPIQAEARKCRYCGETLDPVLRASEEVARTATHAPDPEFNRGIAMVLSFFWPGLGQIYRGALFRGLAWMCAVPVGYICFVIPGLVLHFLCILLAGKRA